MIFLFAAEILVVAGAAAGMVRMRRAGDREWRRHRLLAEAAPIIKAFAEFKVALGEALIPSLRTAAAAVQGFTDTLDRHDAVARELVRLTLGGRPDRPVNHDEALRAVRDQLPARAAWAYPHDLRDTRATGRVIGYVDAPMVLIETPDGERVWWRADLTEILPEQRSAR